jgi:hypothetical protein
MKNDLKTDDLNNPYNAFFENNVAGKYFVDFVREIIVNNHIEAERNPEQARDLTQRAKGAREVLEHITSVLTAKKGGK